jgi:hypothetical protein
MLLGGREDDDLACQSLGGLRTLLDGAAKALLIGGRETRDASDLDQIQREQVAREIVVRRSAFLRAMVGGRLSAGSSSKRRGSRSGSGYARRVPEQLTDAPVAPHPGDGQKHERDRRSDLGHRLRHGVVALDGSVGARIGLRLLRCDPGFRHAERAADSLGGAG